MNSNIRPFDVCMVGESLVDAFYHVDEIFLQKYNLNKTDRNVVTEDVLLQMKAELKDPVYVSGGSLANTAYQLAKMGMNTHFLTKVGQDKAGKTFLKDMRQCNVTMNPASKNYKTFELTVLITPDGERTFVASGFPNLIEFSSKELKVLSFSRYVVIEGFMLLSHKKAVEKIIAEAMRHQCEVIVTLSAPFVVEKITETLDDILNTGCVDLVLGNRDEVHAFKKAYGIEHLEEMEQRNIFCKWLVTHGADDVYYRTPKWYFKMKFDALEKTVDKTGAGDAFAAGFLFHYIRQAGKKAAVLDGMELGHNLAGQVIMIQGARLP